MSAPAFLAHPDNYVLSASLTSSSASSIYPLANLGVLPISKPFRTTGVTSEYIQFDLGSAKAVTLFALINHNLTSGVTITLQGASTPSVTTDPGRVTYTVTWRKYDAFLVLSQTFRYWRVTIADTGNTAGFLSVGYVMIGSYTAAPGCAYGLPFGDAYTNVSVQTEFNVPHNAALAYQVRLGLTFNNLSDANMNILRALFLEVYKNVYPFFWILDVAVNDGYLMRFANDFTRVMDFWRSAQVALIEDSRGAVTAS
jgi:hypothetical protein